MYIFFVLVLFGCLMFCSIKIIHFLIDFVFKPLISNIEINNLYETIENSSIIPEIIKEKVEEKPVKVEIVNKDEDLEKYGFFVERIEDKLDTEPKSWEEYIGQEEIKNTLKETLQAIKNDKTIPYPHILISGNAGYGKSALIHLLAKESGLPLIETVAGNLETKEDIYRLLAQLPKKYPFGIIFIDEIHGLKKEIGEILLPITQTFKVNNRPIPYFTLAGATTDIGLLATKLNPLVDRCKQKFILRPYTNEELAKIINNQAKKRDLKFTKEALLSIASRSRETPRLALGLLDNIYYYAKYKNINEIDNATAIQKMEKLKIYKNGITEKDIYLLNYLNKQTSAVGLNTITQILNIDKQTYQYYIEPFLVRKEYILRTPRGRIISQKGKEFLNEIKISGGVI